jgi:flagellar hook-associated protein 3 FlgL
MTISNVSTQYLTSALTLAVTQTQSQLATATTESSTGQYADLGLQLGDQSGYELSLKNQYNLLQALTNSNSIVSTNLTTTTTTLDAIRTDAQNTLQGLTQWGTGAGAGSTLQSLGTSALQTLISAANTTSSDQYIFGGINSNAAPMADYFSTPTSQAKTDIDAAFQAAFGTTPNSAAASSITSSQMQSFLDTQFASLFQGSSWSSDWSSASSTNVSSVIAPGETVDTGTNANQPAFQQLAQAYAMLTEFGGSSLSQSAQQAVANTASSLITSGISSLIQTESVVGESQSRITDANNSMSSQMTILQTQIGNLDDIDPYKTATEVSTLTTQLQTAYQLTAQLQQLSLAKYLPVA